ncbi:MAG: putative adhesin [Planctomycetota bacterium]
MSKIIVFSGHGQWKLGKDDYVQLPAKCSMKFYTMNARTLSDNLGGDIDRGFIRGLVPDQEAGPFKNIPDMRLYPPNGLNIRRPNPANWHVLELPNRVPVDNKNIQVQINGLYRGGADLKVLFKLLAPAISQAHSVVFLWAACRAVALAPAGGKKVGVNTMQR